MQLLLKGIFDLDKAFQNPCDVIYLWCGSTFASVAYDKDKDNKTICTCMKTLLINYTRFVELCENPAKVKHVRDASVLPHPVQNTR